MKVREYLERHKDEYWEVAVWQKPIEEIDIWKGNVRRFKGTMDNCLRLGGNYLDFVVTQAYPTLVSKVSKRCEIICEPTEEQKEDIIHAFRAKRYNY